MVAIKISSPGKVFFKQERWGRDNRMFTTYKFRSMIPDTIEVDEKGNFKPVTKDDPRVTKIGKFLRKTNLDELPQFWNVLKGEMSLVGPRPHPTPLNIQSRDKIRLYMLRHLVKPGITGWAQVKHKYDESIEDVKIKLRYDLFYIENMSLRMDFKIILRTIFVVLFGKGPYY